MKNLILFRHAKSSWDFPVNDIDRPLLPRGIADAELVAKACINFLPQTFDLQSSIGKRAYETALIFVRVVGISPESIHINEALYTFSGEQLENVVRSFADTHNNVILFGHNEAITNFVNKFGDVYIDNVPTSGFVSLEFDADSWQSIRKGKTLKTLFPKDLK